MRLCLVLSGFLSCAAFSPLWKTVSSAFRRSARDFFVERAEGRGIEWTAMRSKWEQTFPELEECRIAIEDEAVELPDYFCQPFHGYDDGNVCWQAAYELEAATLCMSSSYWPEISAAEAATRMRSNFCVHVQSYIKRTQSMQPKVLLDMGCGMGISTATTVDTVASIDRAVGVDLSSRFLAIGSEALKGRNDVELRLGNVEETRLVEKFDLVTACFLFHEMPASAASRVLKEAHGLLRAGGVVAILDLDQSRLSNMLGYRRFAFFATEPHVREYISSNMADALGRAGFCDVECVENGDGTNVVWIARR